VKLHELLRSTERHRWSLVTIPGEGKVRVYIVSGGIMGDDDTK